MTIGGYDATYAPNGFNYVSLISETYWMISLGGIKVGSNVIDVTGGKAIVDSGTSLLVGDNKIIEKMNPYLGSVKSDCSNIDDLPDIVIELNGVSYTLTSQDWVLKVTALGQTECLAGIQGMDFPSQLENSMILGDVFMRKFYTLFDYTNKRVGFAK